MGATPKSKRVRWREITKKSKDGHCPRCPPHKGENAKRRPKTDKHKRRRSGK